MDPIPISCSSVPRVQRNSTPEAANDGEQGKRRRVNMIRRVECLIQETNEWVPHPEEDSQRYLSLHQACPMWRTLIYSQLKVERHIFLIDQLRCDWVTSLRL